MTGKHIVVMNWHFPPNEGIGGRRTALLVKHWLNQGIAVTVICKKPQPHHQPSDWLDQETLGQIEMVFIDHENPYNALFFKKDTRSKWIRIWKKFYYNFFAVGNPIDQTFFCGDEILHHLKKIHVARPIQWIFTSGAPFYLAYWASLFQAKNDGIQLWCDFRDPWLNAINYGMQHLSAPQRKGDDAVRDFVCHYADFISAPYQEVLDEFEIEDLSKKVLIPHFHDQASIMQGENNPLWIYAGEIYENSEHFWKESLSALAEQKKEIQVDVYTQHYAKVTSLLSSKNVQVLPPIGKKIHQELQNCSAIIISLGEHNKDFFTTKFFDHLTFQKPYLYVGPEGKVLNFIEENKLGTRLEKFDTNQFVYNASLALQLWKEHRAIDMAHLILNKMNGDV